MSDDRLPRNIRQIGNQEPRLRIYMEDYVCTYFRKLRYRRAECAAGLLLGAQEVREGASCVFITGAVEAVGLRAEAGRIALSDFGWKRLRRDLKEYFPASGVCGWFLYEQEEATIDKLSIRRMHEQEFLHGNKVLLHGSGEEENFFVLAGEDFYRLKGYCVYYERNEDMRAYMAARSRAQEPPLAGAPANKSANRSINQPVDNSAVEKRFRDRLEQRTSEHGPAPRRRGALRAACLWGTLLLLGLYAYYSWRGGDTGQVIEAVARVLGFESLP